jgi:uncharacterized protein
MSQGVVRRKDKEMARDEVDALLARAFLAHFATVSASGDPYVVPNLFVYDAGRLQLHTAASGHFRTNVEHRPRISFELAEPGEVFPYGEFECDTSASFESVIGFGAIRIETDDAEKARFFDRFLAKYARPDWDRPKSFYPRLGEVTVYTIAIEQVTGKRSPLFPPAEQWPARNATRSPGAVPPERR